MFSSCPLIKSNLLNYPRRKMANQTEPDAEYILTVLIRSNECVINDCL